MRDSIAAIVDTWLDGWQVFDLERTYSVFDLSHPGFIYQPMELDRPVADLVAYSETVRDKEIKEFKELRWANIEHDVFQDFLWAYVDLVRHTVGHDGREKKGAYRASMFMRRKEDGWKIFQYHESAQPHFGRPRQVGATKGSRIVGSPSEDTLFAIRRGTAQRGSNLTSGTSQQVAEKMVESFVYGWEATDVDVAYSWWDREYDNHIYLALEIAAPARNWKQIDQYRIWQAEDMIKRGTRWDWRMPLAPEDLLVHQVREDLLLVYSRLHARAVPLDKPEPSEEEMPFSTPYREVRLLRRDGGAWKVIHYHESRPTPGPTDVVALGLHPAGLTGG